MGKEQFDSRELYLFYLFFYLFIYLFIYLFYLNKNWYRILILIHKKNGTEGRICGKPRAYHAHPGGREPAKLAAKEDWRQRVVDDAQQELNIY